MSTMNTTEQWICDEIMLQFSKQVITVFDNSQSNADGLYWNALVCYLEGYRGQDIVVTPNTLAFITMSIVKKHHNPGAWDIFERLVASICNAYSDAKKGFDYRYCLKLSTVVNVLRSIGKHQYDAILYK